VLAGAILLQEDIMSNRKGRRCFIKDIYISTEQCLDHQSNQGTDKCDGCEFIDNIDDSPACANCQRTGLCLPAKGLCGKCYGKYRKGELTLPGENKEVEEKIKCKRCHRSDVVVAPIGYCGACKAQIDLVEAEKGQIEKIASLDEIIKETVGDKVEVVKKRKTDQEIISEFKKKWPNAIPSEKQSWMPCILSILVVFSCTFLYYWLSGNDFIRGGLLGNTLLGAILMSIAVVYWQYYFNNKKA
jgi:hypothetical protein